MQTSKACTAAVGEKFEKVSRAKKRRLRKKRLHQVPREDGGEAQAELPPETELVLPAAVAALVKAADIELQQRSVVGSITISPLDTSTGSSLFELKVDNLVEENYETHKAAIIKGSLNSGDQVKNINKKLICGKKSTEESNQEATTKQNTSNIKMSDKQGKKSQKVKPVSLEQAKSPKVVSPISSGAGNKSKKTEVGDNAKNVEVKKLPVTKESSVKNVVQKDAVQSSLSGAVSESEKTREEIMAERKAKKAAKKSKVGKENSKPMQEVPIKVEEGKPVEQALPKPNASTSIQSSTEIAPACPAELSAPVAKTEEKSKAALKEERRLKQEAQRAAKVMASSVKNQEPQPSQKDVKKNIKEAAVASVKPKSSKPQTNLAKLFSHLQRDNTSQISNVNIHPGIIKLGLQYSQHQITGSNARAVALMRAMKRVIEDYVTPPQSELRRDLDSCMQVYMEYLDKCRPISVSMANAMRDLKNRIQQLPTSCSDNDAKKLLIAGIESSDKEDGFINKLDLDCCSVAYNTMEKIKDGDLILTYGCSSLVQRVLLEAKRRDKKFRVVVVGARPWQEAEKMLQILTTQGVRCTYLLINAVSCIMKEVTKVFLGAHCILANGYVKARAGSAQVALIAHNLNVPVIVCCETYKFCDRVQTDAFVHNELANFELQTPSVSNMTQRVLTYDVTPPELVSAVVTEVSMLPCSSVPVVLHMQSSETRLKRRNIVGPPKP